MPTRVAHSSPVLRTAEPTAALASPKVSVLVHDVLHQLSAEELEIAARSSFAFTTLDPTPIQEQQECYSYAAAMAERYLDSNQGRVDKALQQMKATLQFRRDHVLDTSLRTTPVQHDNTRLYTMLRTQKLYVAGRDRAGRSTYVFVPRRVQDHDLESTRKAHLWTLEKAIATTQSPDSTINAMVDFTDFDCIRQAPPLANGRDILTLLRHHYVGHVHRIYLVNTPKSFHWFWSLLAPCVGTGTKNKIVFVTSNSRQQQKEQPLLDLYEPDQIPSWVEGGTWPAAFPIDAFLRLPFDQLLGDP